MSCVVDDDGVMAGVTVGVGASEMDGVLLADSGADAGAGAVTVPDDKVPDDVMLLLGGGSGSGGDVSSALAGVGGDVDIADSEPLESAALATRPRVSAASADRGVVRTAYRMHA
jgi:hypothetical protein